MEQVDGPLPSDVLQQLADSGDVHRFAAGEVLFQEGDLSDALYVLLNGQLKVYSLKGNGREMVYNILDAGEILGEMFLDGGPRSASVKALVASECLIVEGDRTRELMLAHPQFAACLVIKLISRLRHATRQVRSLALDGVYERVVSLLEAAAVDDEGVRRLPRSLTQLEIANQIGATRAMVNYVLRDLVRGGFVHKDERHRMTILRKLPQHW